MSMYKFIEYSNGYLKKSRSLWQQYRDQPVLDKNDIIIIDFVANNKSASFKFKEEVTEETWNNSIKIFKVIIWLKYAGHFGEHLKYF